MCEVWCVKGREWRSHLTPEIVSEDSARLVERMTRRRESPGSAGAMAACEREGEGREGRGVRRRAEGGGTEGEVGGGG